MKIIDLAYILIVEERVYAEELDAGYEKDESGEAQIFGLKLVRNEAAICY